MQKIKSYTDLDTTKVIEKDFTKTFLENILDYIININNLKK